MHRKERNRTVAGQIEAQPPGSLSLPQNAPASYNRPKRLRGNGLRRHFTARRAAARRITGPLGTLRKHHSWTSNSAGFVGIESSGQRGTGLLSGCGFTGKWMSKLTLYFPA